MRILILTERFFPEEFLINDLVSEWKKSGHDIEVLTQVPSYPRDVIFEGYINKLFQTTQEYLDIPIHRVRTVIGYNSGGMKRKIVNYVCFAFLTSIWALFNGWKYDRIFTYHTGPLSMASAALVLHFIWRRKCIIWTQDIWPDSVYSYGVKPTFFMKLFLNCVVKIIYSAFQTILVSCPAFIEKLKPYTSKKITFVPQWTTGIHKLTMRQPDGKRIFTFAGNVGSVQNLEKVIQAFGSLTSDNVELWIVGGGVYLDRLKKKIEFSKYKNIFLTGRRPHQEMEYYFSRTDVLIISLTEKFDLTIPAKFQAYIAAGRPILGIIRGDTAKMIEQYDLGVTADPADISSIINGFMKMYIASDQTLYQWGENAITLSRNQFDRTNILNLIWKKIA